MWRKVARFYWRRVVYFSWPELVYFILPFTLAEARYYKAIASPDYAMTQYAEDLERDKLYADVKRGCQE